MAENTGNWCDTPKVFVAFLDIMGFKHRLQRDSHEEVRKMFETLRPSLRDLEAKAKEKEVKLKETKKQGRGFLARYYDTYPDLRLKPDSYILPVSFSDSIILISNDDTYESAREILSRINLILGIAIDSKIPIKGAVAYGEMTANTKESIYFGQPLIDAVELQKELQLYGVVLHHTFEQRLSDPDFIKGHSLKELINKYVTKYAAPIRSSKITHYVVDWTTLVDLIGDTIESVTNLYSLVSGEPRIYVDNTMEFVREIRKRKAELKKKKKS